MHRCKALRLCTGRTVHRSSRGIAILFLDHGYKRSEGSASRPGRMYPRERPGTHCTGGWVGPRAGLDRCGKFRLHRDSILDCPTRSQSLYRLSYRAGITVAHLLYLTRFRIGFSGPQVGHFRLKFLLFPFSPLELRVTASNCGIECRSLYSNTLRAGRAGDRVPVGIEIFRTLPGRPWSPPSILCNGYRVFPGGNTVGA